MGRSRSHSKSPRRRHKSKHSRKRSKSRERSSHKHADKIRERGVKSRLDYNFDALHFYIVEYRTRIDLASYKKDVG